MIVGIWIMVLAYIDLVFYKGIKVLKAFSWYTDYVMAV